jgi:imidazolonepropionase-like amidohydrolase
VTPTLAAFGGFGRLAAGQRLWSAETAYMQFYHAYERTGWQEAPADTVRVPLLQQTIATLVRAGGRVTAGSDAPAVPYGLGLHAELALLSESGLANDQVLRFATADAALALGLERDLGTLETGKLADFVVLSGDPLTRITDSLRIEAVVKGGVWYERQDLLAPR